MDPETKLGLLLGGLGLTAALIWFVVRKVFGPAPSGGHSRGDGTGGLPPGAD